MNCVTSAVEKMQLTRSKTDKKPFINVVEIQNFIPKPNEIEYPTFLDMNKEEMDLPTEINQIQEEGQVLEPNVRLYESKTKPYDKYKLLKILDKLKFVEKKKCKSDHKEAVFDTREFRTNN